MLRHSEIVCDPNELELGGNFKHVWYGYRMFEQLHPFEQDAFLKLEKHIREHGMLNPLITFRGHVLIGHRRCQIARRLGWKTVRCWEIQDDITDDKNANRVTEIRDKLYQEIE